MSILKALHKRSRLFYFSLFILSLINGVWSNALLLIINNRITGTPIPYYHRSIFVAFLVLIVVSYFAGRLFQTFMMRLTIDLSYEMAMKVFDNVRYSAYDGFTKFGKEKIFALLGDTQTVSG